MGFKIKKYKKNQMLSSNYWAKSLDRCIYSFYVESVVMQHMDIPYLKVL